MTAARTPLSTAYTRARQEGLSGKMQPRKPPQHVPILSPFPPCSGPSGNRTQISTILSIVFIHSLIHSGYLYSAPLRNLLRGALSPATAKEKCLPDTAQRS